MYLVIAHGPMDDIPVRLFTSLKEARAYVKSTRSADEKEPNESLYKDAWDSSKATGSPTLSDINSISIVRFRDGVVSGCLMRKEF